MEEYIAAIGTLMREIKHHEARLQEANERRELLAARLYGQHGPRTYVVDGEELLISRSKPRRDGTVSHFFAAKRKWDKRGGAKATLAEAFEGLARAGLEPPETALGVMPFGLADTAPVGRVIEATAVLTGRAAAHESTPEPLINEELRRTVGPGEASPFLDNRRIGGVCQTCEGTGFYDGSGTRCPTCCTVYVLDDGGCPVRCWVCQAEQYAAPFGMTCANGHQADLSGAPFQVLQTTPFLTHCPKCKQEYVNIQHPAKPAGCIMRRVCGCQVNVAGAYNETITTVAPPALASDPMAALQAEIDAFNAGCRGVTPPTLPTLQERFLQGRAEGGASPAQALAALDDCEQELGLQADQILSVIQQETGVVVDAQPGTTVGLFSLEGKVRLPIAKEAVPEPRLLQIAEPSGMVGVDLETAAPGGVQAVMSDGTVVPLDPDADDLDFLMRGFAPDPDPAEAMQAALSKPGRAKRRKGGGQGVGEAALAATQEAELSSIMDELGIDLDP